MKEKIINKKTIYQGKVVELNVYDVELDNKVISTREVIHHHGGACILAVENGYIYFVEQFRTPYQKTILELPAGKLNDGEDPYFAAIRELEEEVGLKADKLTLIGEIYPSVGYTDEIIYLYYTDSFTHVNQHLDEDEDLNIIKLSIKEVYELIDSKQIKDSKTLAALLYCKDKLI